MKITPVAASFGALVEDVQLGAINERPNTLPWPIMPISHVACTASPLLAMHHKQRNLSKLNSVKAKRLLAHQQHHHFSVISMREHIKPLSTLDSVARQMR